MQEFQASHGSSSQQDTTLHRAKLCVDLGQWKEALTLLTPLLSDASTPAAFRLAFKAHANLGNTRAARRVAEQGLSRWPQEDSLHADLAKALHALSLSHQGLKVIRQAIRLDPEWYGHHHIEASILNHLHQFRAAETAIRQALRLHPNDPDSMWMLAAILFNQGRFDEARPIVQQGLAISPNQADLLMLKGRLEMEHPERVRHFRNSLRVDPLSRDAQKALYREEGGRRRGWILTAATCVALGLLYMLNGPQWVSTLLFVLSGLWLTKGGFLPMQWVTASCYAFFVNIHDAANGPMWPPHIDDATTWLAQLLASALLGVLWTIVIFFAWMLLFRQPGDFLKSLRVARDNGVLPEKLRDLFSSNLALFNLAACALPTVWPLVMYSSSNSGETFAWVLIPAELVILLLARLLFLPREEQYMRLLLLLCAILVLSAVIVSKLVHPMAWELGNQLCASLLVGVGSLLLVNYSITNGETL